MALPEIPDNLENLVKLQEFLKSLRDAIPSAGVNPNGSVAFTGDQSMGGNNLTSVGAPVAGGDATNKTYVDAADTTLNGLITSLDANNIKKNGSVAFTGDQSMGNNKLTNVTDPISAQDAATKAYADSLVGMPALPLALVDEPSGSLSPGGSPTTLPNSQFSFTLASTSTVAIDLSLFSIVGSTVVDNTVTCTFAIKNTDTLVSTNAWQDVVGGTGIGTPGINLALGFSGVKRALMTLVAGTYNFEITAASAGSGGYELTYPMSIVVWLVA